MAVNVSNVRNSRKSRMWSEQDDAQLAILLKRKIKDTTVALRESESPYERNRLKAQRVRYKSMLRKVEAGAYNGDIIFNELRASAALRQESEFASGLHSSMAGGRAYSNAYGNIDFDYEAAYRKKRYYGFVLPLLLTLLTLVMIASVFLGALLPSFAETLDKNTNGMLNLNAMFVYRLGDYEGEVYDIEIRVDENGKWWWPEANYPAGCVIKQGEPAVNIYGTVFDNENEGVLLYSDLGCTEIYLSATDVIKAWFRTKMLENTRIDILEDLSIFEGTSYYYAQFLSGTKADDLVIKKNENGGYDFGVIYNHIGVYGTIIFFILSIIFMVVMLIQNIVRIFTYTTRKLHIVTLLCFIFSLLTLICPAFATCEGTDIGTAFGNYFMSLTASNKFIASKDTSIGVTVTAILPVALCLVMLILPKLFKNRHKDFPTRLPKGNKKIHV